MWTLPNLGEFGPFNPWLDKLELHNQANRSTTIYPKGFMAKKKKLLFSLVHGCLC